MQTSAKTLAHLRFRANPHYELVLFDRLSPSEKEALNGLANDPDGYGILRPREAGRLGVKSASRELALLFYTLREPGAFPKYALRSLGKDSDAAVAKMVLDGILEIEANGQMISGPAAHEYVCPDQTNHQRSDEPTGAIAALSRRALEYAQTLDLADPGILSGRLYNYNRIPVSPRWRSLLPDRAAVEKLLDVHHSTASEFRSDEHWFYWHSARWSYDAAKPTYKLYVSPAMDDLPAVFQVAADVAARSPAASLKVGGDVYGLLRPDKIILYVHTFPELQEAAGHILSRISGCSGHGVPFSADLEVGTLLSWGIDPPRDNYTVKWLQQESWRLWVTNRLASALVLARGSGTAEIEPWRFAVERMRLEGIDTRSWTPLRS